MPADPYVYAGTNCLRNRLGITEAVELERAEAARTSVTLTLLARNPLPGNYDLAHLRAFHRRIFGDIYEWAGELRTVVIAKDDSLFALPQHLDSYLEGLFDELARDAERGTPVPRGQRAHPARVPRTARW